MCPFKKQCDIYSYSISKQEYLQESLTPLCRVQVHYTMVGSHLLHYIKDLGSPKILPPANADEDYRPPQPCWPLQPFY
ncbi:hypothetical protein GDO78_012571 [Eleutherodactylus coqui]|uniref:Uncharacterized protein n=1 Tax=Eleutherodactylus coqui TaxID=57060 RepID=A0A8J6K526_ELECQ|nr:hypothetical protein GDO78_012571 [Eleutherodactylus coqui]